MPDQMHNEQIIRDAARTAAMAIFVMQSEFNVDDDSMKKYANEAVRDLAGDPSLCLIYLSRFRGLTAEDAMKITNYITNKSKED